MIHIFSCRRCPGNFVQLYQFQKECKDRNFRSLKVWTTEAKIERSPMKKNATDSKEDAAPGRRLLLLEARYCIPTVIKGRF